MDVSKKVFMTPFSDSNTYQEILADKLEEMGLEVLTDTSPRPYNLFYNFWFSDADILHLHWIDSLYLTENDNKVKNLVAAALYLGNLFLLKIKSNRIVWTLHNTHNHERKSPVLDKTMRLVTAKLVDKIQVWDENTKKIAKDKFSVSEEKLEVIPHGNYIPTYEKYKNPPQADAREELNLHGGRIYLFFGQIRRYKQVDKLIEVFKDQSEKEEHLLIAGNPATQEIEEELKSLTSDAENIQLDLRYIPEKEVPKYFSAADICVFPYRDIFNSGSVVLASTFGKTVVAPDKGAVKSYLAEGNIVFDDFQEGFKKAQKLSDKELSSIGKENRKIAEEKLSWEKITQKTIEMYVK